MTSVVAALVALSAGSVVAAFLYFKRSAKFPWDLALLRFLWFALLIYAVLAPYGTREVASDRSFAGISSHNEFKVWQRRRLGRQHSTYRVV